MGVVDYVFPNDVDVFMSGSIKVMREARRREGSQDIFYKDVKGGFERRRRILFLEHRPAGLKTADDVQPLLPSIPLPLSLSHQAFG